MGKLLDDQIDNAITFRVKYLNNEVNRVHFDGDFGLGKSFLLKHLILNKNFKLFKYNTNVYFFKISRHLIDNEMNLVLTENIANYFDFKGYHYLFLSSNTELFNEENIKDIVQQSNEIFFDKELVIVDAWNEQLHSDVYTFLINSCLNKFHFNFSFFIFLIALFVTLFSSFLVNIFTIFNLKNENINIVSEPTCIFLFFLLISLFLIVYEKTRIIIMYWFTKIRFLPSSNFIDSVIKYIDSNSKKKIYLFEDLDRMNYRDYEIVTQFINRISNCSIVTSYSLRRLYKQSKDEKISYINTFNKLELETYYYTVYPSHELFFDNEDTVEDKKLFNAVLSVIQEDEDYQIPNPIRFRKYLLNDMKKYYDSRVSTLDNFLYIYIKYKWKTSHVQNLMSEEREILKKLSLKIYDYLERTNFISEIKIPAVDIFNIIYFNGDNFMSTTPWFGCFDDIIELKDQNRIELSVLGIDNLNRTIEMYNRKISNQVDEPYYTESILVNLFYNINSIYQPKIISSLHQKIVDNFDLDLFNNIFDLMKNIKLFDGMSFVSNRPECFTPEGIGALERSPVCTQNKFYFVYNNNNYAHIVDDSGSYKLIRFSKNADGYVENLNGSEYVNIDSTEDEFESLLKQFYSIYSYAFTKEHYYYLFTMKCLNELPDDIDLEGNNIYEAIRHLKSEFPKSDGDIDFPFYGSITY